jgi:cytochrome c-type biogenesis protein CcmH/NrfF
MPKNQLIYYGLILLIGTMGLWIGIELARRILWLLPYLGGVAVIMIAVGVFFEAQRRNKAAAAAATADAETKGTPEDVEV